MEEQTKDLQEYADAHCGGDRYRAIYEIMSSGEQYALDPYVDGMTQEDATFAVYLLREDAIKFYGGEKGFRNAVKVETLAAQMDVSAETAENPFRKKLLPDSLLLAGAVLMPAVLTYFLNRWQVGTSWLVVVQSVLIGICSLRLAETLMRFFRFRKMKRLQRKQTYNETPDGSIRPFEACMEGYRALFKSATPQEAEARLAVAAKKNWLAFGLWFAFVALTVIACLISMAGTAACVIGCTAVVFFALWQIRSAGKATFLTRDAVSGVPADDPKKQSLEKRQSLCVLAMMGIGALYLMVGAFGVAISISLLVR